MDTHYSVLGVGKDATHAEIRTAYERVQKQCLAESETARKAALAYLVLTDEKKREEYDDFLDSAQVSVPSRDNWCRDKFSNHEGTWLDTSASMSQSPANSGQELAVKLREASSPKARYSVKKAVYKNRAETKRPRTAKKASSMGWLFWVQIFVILVATNLAGIVGGVIFWGVWILIARIMRKEGGDS